MQWSLPVKMERVQIPAKKVSAKIGEVLLKGFSSAKKSISAVKEVKTLKKDEHGAWEEKR